MLYTPEQILGMKKRITPAIKMANNWGHQVSIESPEYKEKFKRFKDWAYGKADYCEKILGTSARQEFLGRIATEEIIPFFQAGFDFNYDYLNEVIASIPLNKSLKEFKDQTLAPRISAIRESVTYLALASNACWTAKDEFGLKSTKYNDFLQRVNNHAAISLPLLATEHFTGSPYFADIEAGLQKEATALKTKHISSNSMFEEMGKMQERANKELTKGYINPPLEP
ncbi:MAG: hypothetical protein AB7S44_01005 [Spirochaetales bacterium]